MLEYLWAIDVYGWRQSITANAEAGLAFGVGFITDHPEETFLATVAVLGSMALLVSVRWINTWKARGEAEEMAQRKAYLDQLYADRFGDVLFDMLCKDEISRQEYKRDTRRFGVKYHLKDLLTRKNNQRGTAARVKKNIKAVKLLDASGQPITPKLPDPAKVKPAPRPKKTWVVERKIA